MSSTIRRIFAIAATTGALVVFTAGPALGLHCEQLSKNPDAGQAAEKDGTDQGGGRSWNSGATGGFVGATFARNLLVNAGCGGDEGVYIEDGCLAGLVNPAELYKDFGIAGNGG